MCIQVQDPTGTALVLVKATHGRVLCRTLYEHIGQFGTFVQHELTDLRLVGGGSTEVVWELACMLAGQKVTPDVSYLYARQRGKPEADYVVVCLDAEVGEAICVQIAGTEERGRIVRIPMDQIEVDLSALRLNEILAQITTLGISK